MKKNYISKFSQFYLLLFFMITGIASWGQVGIGTTNPLGAFDVRSTNDGLLIPRVSLISTTSLSLSTTSGIIPFDTPTASELVYNTNTSMDVTPGYYYLSDPTGPWVRLGTGSGGGTTPNPAWERLGNSGTNPTDNFIGTTDAQGLSIRTGGIEKMRVTAAGNIGIGTTNPDASAALEIATTTSGLLPPRLTTAQRDAITLPATGLFLFNVTMAQLQVNTGTPIAPVWTNATVGVLPVPNGGTGLASIPANGIMIGNGTNPVSTIAPGASGQVLTSNGTSWVSAPSTANALTASNGLTRVANDIRLGGTLTANTNIAGNFNLSTTGTGNFGIGIASPAAKLSVVNNGSTEIGGTAFSTIFRTSAGTLPSAIDSELNLGSFAGLTPNNSGLTASLYRVVAGGDWQNTALLLGYDVDNTKRAAGFLSMFRSNVGIGEAVPNYKLTIKGGLPAFAAGMRPLGGLSLGVPATPLVGQIGWVRKPDGTPTLLIQAVEDGVAWRDLSLVRDSGNVGIGTDTPTQKLSVNGNIVIPNQSALFARNAANTADELFLYGRWNDNATYLDGGSGGTYFRTANGSVVNQFLSANGNTGIGTGAPAQKLHVVGNTLISGLAGAGSRMVTADASGVLSANNTYVTVKAQATANTPSIPVAAATSAQAALELIAPAGNAAYISFHKPNQFASNFGLDGDNNFAFGGWSYGDGYADVKMRTLKAFGAIESINGVTPPNGAIRLTPNLHLNSGAGFANYINWDNGAGAATNPTFVVANGAGGELMRVNYNGNVGIGTTTPAQKLSVIGNMSTSGSIFSIGGLTAPAGAGGVINSIFSNSLHLSSAQANPVYINYSNVGGGFPNNASLIIGNAQGGSNATITYGGTITGTAFVTSSDIRLKTNIKPLTNSLSQVLQLEGISYNWIDVESRGKETQIGFIAQEVEKLWPELVNTNKDGFKSVNYVGLIAPITEAIKELNNKNKEGQSQIETLKIENQHLKSELANLKSEFEEMKAFIKSNK